MGLDMDVWRDHDCVQAFKSRTPFMWISNKNSRGIGREVGGGRRARDAIEMIALGIELFTEFPAIRWLFTALIIGFAAN